MATITRVTLHCEWCDTTDMVETYSITVNGQKYEFEACPADYAERIVTPFGAIARTGRKVTPDKVASDPKYTRRTKVEAMPGTEWRFTFHALTRMGQRRISPADVIAVAENPEMTHTSESDDALFVYQGGKVRLTVDPTRKTIVTAALRDDEVSQGNISMEGTVQR